MADIYSDTLCQATLDVRTNLAADYEDGLWGDLQTFLHQYPDIAYSVRDRGKAYLNSIDEIGPCQLCRNSLSFIPKAQVAQGGSDAGYYALITPKIIGGFGPGDKDQCHTATERIALATLQSTSYVFSKVINEFISLDL